jgi:hypothetical protein
VRYNSVLPKVKVVAAVRTHHQTHQRLAAATAHDQVALPKHPDRRQRQRKAHHQFPDAAQHVGPERIYLVVEEAEDGPEERPLHGALKLGAQPVQGVEQGSGETHGSVTPG